MARKKETPPPLFSVRHEFVAALENTCQQAIMLLQAVELVIKNDVPDIKLPDAVRGILVERAKAMRAALMSEDE
jgi:hypothetical protein